MSKFKIDILDNNTIEIFDIENPTKTGAPFIRQDVHPDGRAWTDSEEAIAWADAFIIQFTTPPVEETPNE
jgi:hypothetical protein